MAGSHISFLPIFIKVITMYIQFIIFITVYEIFLVYNVKGHTLCLWS